MNPASLIMPGFRFGVHNPDEAESLAKAGVSGFCLYGGWAGDVAQLIQRLNQASGRPLIFASDFENGAGSQLPDMVEMPSNCGIGASRKKSLAYLKGQITGKQAAMLGINLVFAPDVDLLVQPENPIVNIRSYGAKPQEVTVLARAFIAGLKKNKIASCLKHFPGHGDTQTDSHLDLAHIRRNWKKLKNEDLQPYFKLAPLAESVMPGHLVLKKIDEKPASLSAAWITDILRKKIKFQGLVITDALMMGAMLKNFSEDKILELAINAGADILLYPKNPWRAIAMLKRLLAQRRLNTDNLKESNQRLKRFRTRLPAPQPLHLKDFQAMEAKHFVQAQSMARICVAWFKNAPRLKIPPNACVLYHEIGNAPIQKTALAPLLGAAKERNLELTSLMHERQNNTSLKHLLNGAGFITELPAENLSSHKIQLALVAVFRKPQAFRGRIGLNAQELKLIVKMTGRQHSLPVLVASFGDPYFLRKLPARFAGLCLFSGSLAAQTAFVEFLQGKIKITRRFS